MLTRPSLPLLSAFTYRNEKLLQDPVRLRQISERIPAGRWGEPRDFAGPVVFLASAASQYVCGELLVVDGVRLLYLFLSLFLSFFVVYSRLGPFNTFTPSSLHSSSPYSTQTQTFQTPPQSHYTV